MRITIDFIKVFLFRGNFQKKNFLMNFAETFLEYIVTWQSSSSISLPEPPLTSSTRKLLIYPKLQGQKPKICSPAYLTFSFRHSKRWSFSEQLQNMMANGNPDSPAVPLHKTFLHWESNKHSNAFFDYKYGRLSVWALRCGRHKYSWVLNFLGFSPFPEGAEKKRLSTGMILAKKRNVAAICEAYG